MSTMRVGLTDAQREKLGAMREMDNGIELEQAIKVLARDCGVSPKAVRAELGTGGNGRHAPAAVATENTEKKPVDLEELLAAGQEILDASDVLALLRGTLTQLGYAGSPEAAELVYLALHSRHLERPVNLFLEGPSAAGKTFTLETAARFHPPEALHDLTGASERALIYTDRDFRHSFVSIAEASAFHEDGIGASIIRSLAWGKGIKYDTVEKIGGRMVGTTVEKEGPTGLVTTTTKTLEPEIGTRLLAVPIPDTNELTRAVMRMQAREAQGLKVEKPDLESWVAAARWLHHAGEHRVVVPFAPHLAEEVPDDDVRLRRDFMQILSLIKTCAMIHQRTREQDEAGRIVAIEADYETVQRLLVRVLAATVDAVSDTVRATVAAVAELLPSHSEGVPVIALAERFRMSRQGAHKRAVAAVERGFLVNAEERHGRPYRLVMGDSLPEPRVVLPEFSGNWVDGLTPPRGAVNRETEKPGTRPTENGSSDWSLDDGRIEVPLDS